MSAALPGCVLRDSNPKKKGRKIMCTLFAQPYDIMAAGFYFEDEDEYAEKAAALRNDYGDPVEEFEIQFIDGEDIDAALFNAYGVNQANLFRFFEAQREWVVDQKRQLIIAITECGLGFDPETDDPDDYDICIYEVESLNDLACEFVHDGAFGFVSEHLSYYIDYNAIARDLSVDYHETEIAGARFVYACC